MAGSRRGRVALRQRSRSLRPLQSTPELGHLTTAPRAGGRAL